VVPVPLSAGHSLLRALRAVFEAREVRVRPIFAWYDLWVGAFVDRSKRRLYIFPLPCFGVVIQLRGDSND
jgi:hypothetical protein